MPTRQITAVPAASDATAAAGLLARATRGIAAAAR
jgi:hypothetical protein